MKIVVVSDTHMPRMNKKLPDRLIQELHTADAIIHAGDWTSLTVYDALAAYAPTYGVAGNNDGADIINKFGYEKLLNFGACRIGVVHGHGTGSRIDTETRARETFKSARLDALIFGHSHVPLLKHAGSTLIFNPGSPTDKRRQSSYSFGIIKAADGSIKAKHIYYTDKT